MKSLQLKRIGTGLGVLLVTLVAGYMLIRPWHLRWGASDEEVNRAMPGDLDGRRWTRAITVNAPPEAIWPWLVQWGQGRGGWYSYDWLENLFGMDIQSAERILPEFQNLAIGDPICLARGVCISKVTTIEPNRWLSWQSADETGNPVWTFTFGLFPIDQTQTRLVIRESFHRNALPAPALLAIEIPDVVMEQKALNTVKVRAESRVEPGIITVYEIGVWLAALVMGVISGWLYVTQRQGRRGLANGTVAVLVLLLLTFAFPPYWLRGVLDLGLLAGLVWSFREYERK